MLTHSFVLFSRLDNNKLAKLDDCVSKMKALKLLTLSENQLTDLPNMTDLVALKELVLTSNSFTAFPESVCAIPKLAVLSLAGNKISSIPDTCASCPVTTLFVSLLNLSSISPFLFMFCVFSSVTWIRIPSQHSPTI